ncbi:MAG: arabinose-5-phosphate isomerase [Halobacteriovoraceae bacterium]|nr:arabinose-5-phosphate isomerase [Halobacteriovoraceae bacterium]|tara:strand:+ start:17237 stop:18175 length:939 start_codon:yes stop_codon:yes gene_type:complete
MSAINIAKKVFEIEAEGLNEVKNKLPKNFDEIISAIINSKGRCVITGMGKSGIVGKKISATLASTGTRSFFIHPAEAYHGDLGMIHSGDIIVAISNSGETEELIKLLSFFKENGNQVIAMTGKSESTLATHSDFLLDIGISKEACPLELAPTTSTTVTMAMGDALAVALMKARDFKAENFAKFHPGGSLGRKLLTKVSNVMKTQNLPLLDLEMDFDNVLKVISDGRLGLGVVIEDEKPIGVITDGDIRRILKSKKEKALSLHAKDFFTKDPKTIATDMKLVQAEEIMQTQKISTLLVVEDEKLKGILHRYDI